MEPHVITYRFEVEDGTSATFPVVLDPETFLAPPPESAPPQWARLDVHQCPNCPLDPTDHPWCPAALQLPRILETFDHLFSYAQARVDVRTPDRTVAQDTSIQQGIGALMGLVMAASGCPITAFFRPMARFHLPFATEEETLFRAAATCLLGNYFRARETDGEMDASLEGLTRVYQAVHDMNMAMARRIRAATRTDSSVNALIVLDMFSLVLPLEVESQLAGLRGLFQPVLSWEAGKSGGG